MSETPHTAKGKSVGELLAPSLPPLSEPDTADAESFLADMLLIFPILGFLEGIACRGVRPPLLQVRARDPLMPIA